MWRLNCGCGNISEPIETEIAIPIHYSSNIIFEVPVCGEQDNALKEKIIQDFLDIINKLECGIQPDLENILEEISLIEMKKDYSLNIVKQSKDCNFIVAYSGWSDTPENIDINKGTEVIIDNKTFTTVEGEDFFVWFAIPSDEIVKLVENARFPGDFIQNNLVKIQNQTVKNIDYKIYYYEFLGLPSDNRYNVTLK